MTLNDVINITEKTVNDVISIGEKTVWQYRSAWPWAVMGVTFAVLATAQWSMPASIFFMLMNGVATHCGVKVAEIYVEFKEISDTLKNDYNELKNDTLAKFKNTLESVDKLTSSLNQVIQDIESSAAHSLTVMENNASSVVDDIKATEGKGVQWMRGIFNLAAHAKPQVDRSITASANDYTGDGNAANKIVKQKK